MAADASSWDVTSHRSWRAGASIEDYCRACKSDRTHTIIVVDGSGQPLRVQCGYCDSQHNYRGGPRVDARPASGPLPPAAPRSTPAASDAAAGGYAMPIVTERERTAPAMSVSTGSEDLELLLRRIIREEAGITPVAPAVKWRGGTLVLRPGTPGLQEKSLPIETFFHKIVMLRNRLRTLEQQVNASDLPDDVKLKLQGYVSGCYGSLTSFNLLFANEEDQFKGAGGD
jgi:hypothetical protein